MYRTVALQVSDQSHPSDPTFEAADTLESAMKFRIPLGQSLSSMEKRRPVHLDATFPGQRPFHLAPASSFEMVDG